jgi:pilus assembly protein FimV
MRRELVRSAATMLLLLGCGQAHALGLGPATVSSDLASPLRADIPITRIAGSGIDPDAIAVDVPGFNEHARLGFPEPVLPADLAVSVVRDADGGARLHLSTQRAVREPVLRFLLRASWPGGSAVREYALLLDLPQAMRPSEAGAAVRTGVSTTPALDATPSPPSRALHGNPFQRAAPARAGSRFGPVALGDTLSAILDSAYPGRDHDALAQAVVARNPQAFAAGDPGRLLIGAMLELPPAAPIARSDAVSAGRPPLAAAPGTATATRYVVQPGDTLYAIVRAMVGSGRAQVAAVARRVFERNPQAFIDGDIDRLRAGATLQLDAVPAAAALPGAPEARTGAASATAPSGEIEGLQSEMARIQGVVGAARERQSALRDRLARTERAIAALRERDAALSAATEALREQLTAATVAPAPPAAAGTGMPRASAAAATAAPAPVTPAPARPATPAATTPSSVPVPATPGRAAAIAPAADRQATIPNRTWLAAGLGILALLALLAVRRWRARTHEARAAQAARPRQGDEEASRRRLAEVRDAHANRLRAADAGSAPAGAVATADVRHTDSGRASALAKEAAVHLAYGDHHAAHTSIVEAIKLAPHQDEHKMLLMTVYQAMGDRERARAIVDELLNRREQLSNKVRAQVDQQVRRLMRA